MRIVVALGGNALLRRGEPMTTANQRANVRRACRSLAPLADGNELVITHGNGPQVGLLALQSAALQAQEPDPLDVLGAESEGMIGYLIEQELGNLVPTERRLATIMTMVQVDRDDPAFAHPTKPIGPVYQQEQAHRLAAERGWSVAPDTGGWRRVVASPQPKRIWELQPIRWLLERGCVVICAGGGGIPTVLGDGVLEGVEAVIDKDRASALLARELGADLFIVATDVDGVYAGYGTPQQRRIREATPEALCALGLPEGSMGPKVQAAGEFVRLTGGRAVIGSLDLVGEMLAGEAGTTVSTGAAGLVLC